LVVYATEYRMVSSSSGAVAVLRIRLRPVEHRALAQTFFLDATKGALRRVREAAADAAAAEQAGEEGIDPETMRDRVVKALGFIGEKSFRERAEEVVARALQAVPEIAVSIPSLAACPTDPRHAFAHQLPQDKMKDPLEARIRRWTVVSLVTPWVLRVVLLLAVGVDADLLRQKCLENERFAFFWQNTALRARELDWGPGDRDRCWPM
jgi:hypothetical protein